MLIRSDLQLPELQLELGATRLALPADGGRGAVHHLGAGLGLDGPARSLSNHTPSGIVAADPACGQWAALPNDPALRSLLGDNVWGR